MIQFTTKTSETFKAAIHSLSKESHYNFTVLKELTQGVHENDDKSNEASINKNDNDDETINAIDSDQMLFFKVNIMILYFIIIYPWKYILHSSNSPITITITMRLHSGKKKLFF